MHGCYMRGAHGPVSYTHLDVYKRQAHVVADVGRHVFPQRQALGGQRQLAGVAVLLAAPAPVAARLLGADQALLDQGDRQPTLGQVVGGEAVSYTHLDVYKRQPHRRTGSP